MRVTEAARFALDQDLASVRTPVAAQALEQVRLALGLEGHDAEHLAAAEGEGHVLQQARAEAADLDRRAGVDLWRRRRVGDSSFRHDHGCRGRAEHERDDLLLAARREIDDPDRTSIPKHGGAVAECFHLGHPVRDQHHRAALVAPSAGHPKHALAEVRR